MYTKDKNHRVTLRMNDEQYAFVLMNAEMLDCSPSDFLRMVINASLSSYKQLSSNEAFMGDLANKIQEVAGRENDKARFDNIV